jgi:hypothetical protein
MACPMLSVRFYHNRIPFKPAGDINRCRMAEGEGLSPVDRNSEGFGLDELNNLPDNIARES